MNRTQVTYTPCPGATPEAEVVALASVYSFVLRCAQEKKRAGVGPARDDRKESNDPATPNSIPE